MWVGVWGVERGGGQTLKLCSTQGHPAASWGHPFSHGPRPPFRQRQHRVAPGGCPALLVSWGGREVRCASHTTHTYTPHIMDTTHAKHRTWTHTTP